MTLATSQPMLLMTQKLESEGVKHELIVLPNVNHSFIGKTPQQTRDANLKALANTFKFIDRIIGDCAEAQPSDR